MSRRWRTSPAGTSANRFVRFSSESSTSKRKQLQRIVDKLQIAMLRRHGLLDYIEGLLDGVLGELRRDDRGNGEP